MALPAAPPAMIVLKGYHVGSKWFAESFNALPGGAFFNKEQEKEKSKHLSRGQSPLLLPECSIVAAGPYNNLHGCASVNKI